MGWLFGHEQTKQEVIARIVDVGGKAHPDRSTTVAHRCVGKTLYVVFETERDGQAPHRWIGVYLLDYHKPDRRTGWPGGWGYKDMCEEMGPYSYDCPLEFLDLAPVACAEWRDGVREWHRQETERRELLKRVKVGAVVELDGCKPAVFHVVSLAPLLGEAIDGGRRYRLPKSRIKAVLPVEVAAPAAGVAA